MNVDDAPAVVDALPTPSDAGPTPADAGPAPVDAGPTPADAGPAPGDASLEPLRPCGSATLGFVAGEQAQLVHTTNGVVVAWYPGGSVISVSSYTDGLEPRATRAAVIGLPLNLTNGTETLSLAFAGDRGVLAAGSSLFALSLGSDGALAMTNRFDFPRRLVRSVHAIDATNFYAVMADGEVIVTNGTVMRSNRPNASLSPPHGGGVTTIFTDGSGYASFEPRATRGGMMLHMRRFIFGHGASIESTSVDAEGESASPVVRVGDSLLRLVTTGTRERDMLLERRELESSMLRGAPVMLQERAAWNTARGAITAAGDEAFIAWSAKSEGSGFNSTLRALWTSERGSRELLRDERDSELRVLHAASDRPATRAWVLFSSRDRAGVTTLQARCVMR